MEYYNKQVLNESGSHIRYIKMNLDEIPSINKVGKIIQFDNGIYVSARSTRMRLFLEKKDIKCHCCGIRTSFAAVEKGLKDLSTDRPHMNFYAIDENGHEVLMTWDHNKPKSLGGTDSLKNAQCMCLICNELKSNNKTIEQVLELRKEKGLKSYN